MSDYNLTISKKFIDEQKERLLKSDIQLTEEYQMGVHSNGSNRWCNTYDVIKDIITEL